MNNRHYELRKWLILNTNNIENAKYLYNLIKDFNKGDIELYQSLFDGNHNTTLEKMDFVKKSINGIEELQNELDMYKKLIQDLKKERVSGKLLPLKMGDSYIYTSSILDNFEL